MSQMSSSSEGPVRSIPYRPVTDTPAPCREGTKGDGDRVRESLGWAPGRLASTGAHKHRECCGPGWQEVGIYRHAERRPQKP